MSYDEYWNMDCQLVKAYREAEKIKAERDNQKAWLQGMYFYHALADVSPLLHAFASGDVKPLPYPEEPFPIGPTNKKPQQEPKIDNEYATGFGVFAKDYNRIRQKRSEMNGDRRDS